GLHTLFLAFQKDGDSVVGMRPECIGPAVVALERIEHAGRVAAIVVVVLGKAEPQLAFPPARDAVRAGQTVGLLAVDGVGVRIRREFVVIVATRISVVSRQADAVALGPAVAERAGHSVTAGPV